MNVEAVSMAFAAVFTPYNMLVVCGGTILGIFIGAMPGMSSVMGLSIMLPFTFQLHDTLSGIEHIRHFQPGARIQPYRGSIC